MIAPLILAALFQVPAPTQELAPGTRYDPSIPTLEQVVGHDFRAEVTPPDGVIRYMEALHEAAPDRTRLIRYATSWEGRPLMVMVLGTPERIARLDAIKADLRALNDPRGLSEAEGRALVERLPVVTMILHGIHGNEISSSGAAMAEAYHLLAAQGDPDIDLVFRESLVLIDPMENPDGRARFVFQNSMGRSRWEDAATWSAEHDEGWPGGRGNHYLFDMNRDLFIQSQPETRGKVAVLLEYRPQIVADLHEMGGNSTYFFPPTAPPSNPWFTEEQIQLMDVFGSANAAAFDRRGFSYFNRDTYDLFYPGYVDMWPMTHGALGMTYEQASARALVLRRDDGDLMTYGDGVTHHFTSAIQTMVTAAKNREAILRDYLAFRRDGVRGSDRGPAEYVLTSHDPGMTARLAQLLVHNGVEVFEASGPARVGTRTLEAAGTYIVPLTQPASRMARMLLDPHVPMDTAFIQRQIELRARRERDEIYDVTAWSQSLLWDVEVLSADRPTGARGEKLGFRAFPEESDFSSEAEALPPATVAYLMPWGIDAAQAAAVALREGVRIRSAGGDFTLGGRHYGVGTAIIRVAENGPDLARRLGVIAAGTGAEIVPVDDSYVREGTSLGSGSTRALREPRVMLVYDSPGSSLSVGWARYVLERRYGQRTSAVRASSLGRAQLSEYDVIVFPSGNYASAVNRGLVDRIQQWMRDGGTVVTLGESTRWATLDNVGLLATKAERRGGRAEGMDPPKQDTPDQPIDYLEAIAPPDEGPESVPGAILRGILDTDHWLAAGTDGEIGVFAESSRVFSPITLDEGVNVGRFAPLEDLTLSGTVWREAQPQLANKPFLIHQPVGRGQIIAFAEDPNYRAYTESTMLLFMNAVLLGPGR
ncbi:MAG TPA: M14 family zinc carboxypeptidase [Longimicrobiales bacterium]|nr:M14 family zinc carboxypeptidase [Longimicrobiales bacterium]